MLDTDIKIYQDTIREIRRDRRDYERSFRLFRDLLSPDLPTHSLIDCAARILTACREYPHLLGGSAYAEDLCRKGGGGLLEQAQKLLELEAKNNKASAQ